MGWANRLSLSGLIVSYSTFRQMWEVIEKQGDYEVVFRWFPSKQKVDNFCLGRIKSR